MSGTVAVSLQRVLTSGILIMKQLGVGTQVAEMPAPHTQVEKQTVAAWVQEQQPRTARRWCASRPMPAPGPRSRTELANFASMHKSSLQSRLSTTRAAPTSSVGNRRHSRQPFDSRPSDTLLQICGQIHTSDVLNKQKSQLPSNLLRAPRLLTGASEATPNLRPPASIWR